jgi:hypothetical protein
MARKKAPVEPAADDIFAHFERHGRSLNGPDEAPVKQDNAQTELLARLAALEQQNTTLQDQIRRSTLYGTPTQTPDPRGQVTYKDIKPDFSGIPSQIEDPEGFSRALAERTTTAFEAREAAREQHQREQAERSAAATGMWEAFSNAYPDWKPHEDVVETVSGKVAERAKAAGMDMQKYFGASRDLFFADVAAELQKKYGKLIEADDGTPAPAAKRRDENEDEGRTAGIFGGNETGGKPTAASGQARPGMLEDLQALQKKMGLF